MGIYRDYYNITLSVNGNEVGLIPNSYSFSMTDSIHKLFSVGRVYLNDETGLLQEYLGTDIGNRVGITFGTEEEYNSNNYIIVDNNLSESSTVKYLSGEVDVSLKHEWFNYQFRSSDSFDDRISEIIKTKLLEGYNFTDTDINDTQNRDYWYKGNKTQSEFIKEVLLPRAYSTNSDNTPFFAYITNNNEFHFRHLNDMYNDKAKARFVYDPTLGNTTGDFEQQFAIYEIVKWQTPIDEKTKKQRHIETYLLNKDGTFERKGREDLSAHNRMNGKTPILNDGNNTTDVFTYLLRNQFTDSAKGKINNLFRENLFTDRFLITTPLNPQLKSGDKIDIEVYRQDDGGESLSERYSGSYIIEMATHRWDKDSSIGDSQFLIGRSSTTLPREYIFSRLAMEG